MRCVVLKPKEPSRPTLVRTIFETNISWMKNRAFASMCVSVPRENCRKAIRSYWKLLLRCMIWVLRERRALSRRKSPAILSAGALCEETRCVLCCARKVSDSGIRGKWPCIETQGRTRLGWIVSRCGASCFEVQKNPFCHQLCAFLVLLSRRAALSALFHSAPINNQTRVWDKALFNTTHWDWAHCKYY